MPEITARRKREFLANPAHYPDRPPAVEVVETHFAWVFLTDRHVYKMKKPARQATMDYRTLAARERGCCNELELNRRLAPSVYLDVVPLGREANGGLRLGSGENVVEWLVKMRRLSSSRMLDRAIETGSVTDPELDAVVRLMGSFYRRTDRAPAKPPDYIDRLRSRILETDSRLKADDLGLCPARIEAVTDTQRSFMDGAEALLGPRGSHLLNAHGDLRPEHVWLGPEPCVIDCLEFDPDLRRLDPAQEMTQLALGCDRLGRPDLAAKLIDGYRARMADAVPDSLLGFYASERAAVGAMLAAWHMRDPMYERREPWIDLAHSLLEDALRHARAALRALGNAGGSVGNRGRPPLAQRHQRPSG